MDIAPLLRILLWLTLQTCTTAQRDVDFCPQTWIHILDLCHKFGSKVLDFHSAREECLKMGADLAIIRSEGIVTRLQEMMPEPGFNFSGQEFWIGLYKHPASDSGFTWQWTTGATTDFFLENVQIPTGNGSAVWMNDLGFGISEMTEQKPYICQRGMLLRYKEYCFNAICVTVHHFGANHSGESSRDQCQRKGSDIPIEGADVRIWKFLEELMTMFKMNKPVWVQGIDGKYKCWRSIFDRTPCVAGENGRTVCISDNYGKFKVPQCPCKWGEWNNNCYFVTGLQVTRRSFKEAIEFCHVNDSELATIDSLEDFNYFKRNYGQLHNERTYWIARGKFAPTVQVSHEDQTSNTSFNTPKCLLLRIRYNRGKTIGAKIEERDCSESRHFICKMGLQTDFPISTCTEGTFKQVCYHRMRRRVPYTEVSCDLGQPLSVPMLNIILHNTKGTPLDHGLLWKFTAPTGCLAYWIKDGNSYLRFRPQRRYSSFYIMYKYKSEMESLPIICVTEHILLAPKLGIAAGLLLLLFTFLLGIVWLTIHRRRKTEAIYCEMNDCKPVLPPRGDFETRLSKFQTTTPTTQAAREVNFHKNDAYEPFPDNTELHM